MGPPGADGADGINGEPGPPGPQGATGVPGLRVNGSLATARSFWNFLNTVDGQWATIDDAGANESELRFTPLGAFYAANSGPTTQTKFVSFDNGTNTSASVVNNTGTSGYINVSFNVDNYPLSGLADQAGNTIVANATASSAAPTALAIGLNSFPARLGVNLVSHPFSSLAGAGLSYSSGAINVEAATGGHLAFTDSTASGQLLFRKSRRRHVWWEDFDFVEEFEVGGFKQVHFGNTTWASEGTTGGDHLFIAGEANHPGILRMATSGALSSSATIFRGGDNAFEYMLAEDVYALEVVARIVTATSVLVDFGFASDATGTVTDRIIFEFDTNSDTTIHTITEEGDVATNNDTDVAPGTGWNVYTILQESPGTVEFFIDDVLETTHSTNVPDAEGVNVFARVLSRTAAVRNLDLDYIAFESQDLGARTS
jgi:hypothetical protein